MKPMDKMVRDSGLEGTFQDIVDSLLVPTKVGADMVEINRLQTEIRMYREALHTIVQSPYGVPNEYTYKEAADAFQGIALKALESQDG